MTDAITPATHLIDAQRDADAARQRVSTTVAILQQRLQPRRLAREVAHEATVFGRDAATRSIKTAIMNPGAVAGSFAAIALLLLRKPLWRLVRPRRETPSDAIIPITRTEP